MAATEGRRVEVLFEWGKSKEVVKIRPEDLEAYVKAKLPSSSASSPNLLPYDACPPVKGNYILQKWSERWKCYVNADKEIEDGDRLIAVECDCEVTTKTKTICQSLAKPSEATTKSLAKLFPGTFKRKFDPLSECINSESKRKKKAAVPRCKGRPRQITVVYLQLNPNLLPKGIAREKLKAEGRIKDVPFFRYISRDEVKDLINEVFPNCTKDFVFLQSHKDNTLSLASGQELDGNGVIELAKHGSLYLLEQPSALESSASVNLPAADVQNVLSSTLPASVTEKSSSASVNLTQKSSASVNLPVQNVLLSTLLASVTGKSSSASVNLPASDMQDKSLSKMPASGTRSAAASLLRSLLSDVPLSTSVTGSSSSIPVTSEVAQPVKSSLSDESKDLMQRADEIIDKLKQPVLPKGYSYADCIIDSSSDDDEVKVIDKDYLDDVRKLRMEQDFEYFESLEIDSAKEKEKKEEYEWTQKVADLQSHLREKFAHQPVCVEGIVVSFKLLSGDSIVFTFQENATMKDFYQFVAQHVKPLFVLRVPHPQKELPLPEVATESAQIYSNHVLVVQKKEGRNLQELMLFHDAPPEVPSAPCASSELEEEKVIYINQSEKERLEYMKSINATKGELYTVDRDNIYEDVVDMYRTGDIVGECPIKIKYSDEQAIDDGGVQRDMYSAFWDEAYSKLFEGATSLVPMVHPHIDMIFSILGRILSHGFLISGHFPVRVVLPTLINMVLGPTKVPSKVFLDAFLDHISSTERMVFRSALKFCNGNKRFPEDIKDTLLEVLSRFGCRGLPSPDNLISNIQRVAEYEFLIKPAAAISLINSGIPKTHREFWSNKTVDSIIFIYENLTATSEKILDLLMLPEANSVGESRVYGYLTTMVGNMNTDELRSLLRFITGSSVCSVTEILVTFNSLSGLARRPIAHTCDCTLELSTTYINYNDFYGEFQAILSKVNKEFSFRMDAL